MKIVISGGTGFIGKPLIRKLLEKGHKIVLITRNKEKARGIFENSHGIEYLNLSNSSDIKDNISGTDAVINLAGANLGEKPWTKKEKKKILDSRIKTTAMLVNGCLQADKKPGVFIQASAIGYYGHRAEMTLDEESGKGKGFLAEVVDKWEKTALPLKENGIRLVCLRTGVVLGKNEGFLSKAGLMFKFFLGGPFGNGRQWLSWIHIEDEVRAIIFLLENGDAHGPFNLNAPNPLRMKDFFNIYGKIIHRPSWLPVPAIMLKLFMGQRARELLLISQKVSSKKLQDTGFQFNFTSAEKALKDILKKA